MDGIVHAIAADGEGRVYVGGDFIAAGDTGMHNIAWWDGERWHDPGGGTDAPVRALIVDPYGNVFAGGDFTWIGGLPFRYLAMWDGFSWNAVGGGVSNKVRALTIDRRGDIYVGGRFTTAGDIDASHVAVWDGREWHPLGPGIDEDITDLAVDPWGNVVAATIYNNPLGGTEYRVWRWDGQQWTQLYASGTALTAIAAGHDGHVYLGVETSGGITGWDGQAWSTVGRGFNASVDALVVDGDGYVYAAGPFTASGSTSVSRIARWNGQVWSPLGSGINFAGSALGADVNGIYVGGIFTTAGGKAARHVGWYHAGPAANPLTPSPTPAGVCYALTVDRSDGGTVRVLTSRNCAGGFLAGTVVRLRAEPDAGRRWLRWRGAATGPSALTNLTMAGDLTVGATFTDLPGRRSAVVLLHGWTGHPGGRTWHCPSPPHPQHIDQTDIDGGALADDDLDVLARHLLTDGLEVWLATYDTGPAAGGAIPENAVCLARQLASLRQDGVEEVVLVAHDLGGLVARAYLESSDHAADRARGSVPLVTRLVTLGTPHAGTASAPLGCRLEAPTGRDHPGLCALPYGDIDTFNRRTFSQRPADARYDLLGGRLTPGLNWLVPWQTTTTSHDGAVSIESALGRADDRAWPEPWRALTRVVLGAGNGTAVGRQSVAAAHQSPAEWRDPGRRWFPSFFNTTPGDLTPTATYRCLLEILGLAADGCDPPPSAAHLLAANGRRPFARAAAETAVDPWSTTSLQSGAYLPGQVLERSFRLDGTGPAVVALTWVTGTLRFSLTDPDGRTIGPSFAAASADVDYVGPTTHEAAELAAGYFFTNTVTGPYTATISASDVPPDGTRWAMAAAASASRALYITTDRRLYPAGATAIITAGITNGVAGLAGASVRLDLAVPGQPVLSAGSVDVGGGLYVGTLTLPGVGGRFPLRVTAVGSDGGVGFDRVALGMLYVDAGEVRPTGTYTDTVRDTDEDGLYDRLDVGVGLTAAAGGTVLISGDLVDLSGAVLAHAVVRQSLATGTLTTTLPFDGDAVRRAAVDGPYRLTRLTITAAGDSLDPVFLSDAVVHTTAAVPASDFAATCYVLDVRIEPSSGGQVRLDPLPSCNQGLQHPGGDYVSLRATAASGYTFVGWSGDLDGSEPLQMLLADRDHTVTARFVALPTPTPTATATLVASPTASPTPTADPVLPSTTPYTPSPTPTSDEGPDQTPTSDPAGATPTATATRFPGPVLLPVVSTH